MSTQDFTTEETLNNRQKEINFSDHIFYAIVIGCGGIGSWVGLNLALSGRVSNLVLIDPDKIEETNLNRTPFRICDIGTYKVDALKYLILERRCIDIFVYKQETSKNLADIINAHILSLKSSYTNRDLMYETTLIVDCRDNVFSDFYHLNSKYYKLGYDGLSITIDGNPKNTPVWGQQNTYRYTPSFICPSQLVANLVVNDILTNQERNLDLEYQHYKCDQ